MYLVQTYWNDDMWSKRDIYHHRNRPNALPLQIIVKINVIGEFQKNNN